MARTRQVARLHNFQLEKKYSTGSLQIENRTIFSTSATIHPTVLLKTRDSSHKVSLPLLYANSAVFADAVRKNPLITEYFIDINDSEDNLYYFVIYISTNQQPIEFNYSHCCFLEEISSILEIPRLYNISHRIKSKSINLGENEEINSKIQELIDQQDMFLNVTEDTIDRLKIYIKNSDMLEDEIGVAQLFDYVRLMMNVRPNNIAIAHQIIRFIIENSFSESKSIFLRMTVSFCEQGYYPVPALCQLIDEGFYSAQEIFDAVYPRCINFNRLSQVFAPEIYKIDPIIFENLDYNYNPIPDFSIIGTFHPKPPEEWETHKICRIHGCLPKTIQWALKYDDINLLQDITSQPTFDINNSIDWSIYCRFTNILNNNNVFKIAAFFGSVKCFKFLLLNYKLPEERIPNYYCYNNNISKLQNFAVYGGSLEIIHLLEQHGYTKKFDACKSVAASFHRMEIFRWILEHNQALNEGDDFSDFSDSQIVSGTLANGNIEALRYLEKEIQKQDIWHSQNILPLSIWKFMNIYSLAGSIDYFLQIAAQHDFVEVFHYIKTTKMFRAQSYSNVFTTAIENRSINVIKFFLEQPFFDANARDAAITPIQIAEIKGYEEIISLLRSYHAAPDHSYTLTQVSQTFFEDTYINVDVFRYSRDFPPDFTIKTRTREYKVHFYVISAFSNVVLRAYLENHFVREIFLDTDIDLTDFIPLFSGFPTPQYIDGVDVKDLLPLFEAANQFEASNKYEEVMNIETMNISKFQDLFDLQNAFLNLTKNNFDIQSILTNPHVVQKNYPAVIHCLDLVLEIRPCLRSIWIDIVKYLLLISEDFKEFILDDIFDRPRNNAQIYYQFAATLLDAGILNKNEIVKKIKISIVKSDYNYMNALMIMFFAPEIEELNPTLLENFILNISLEEYVTLRKNNWKLLKECRLYGDSVGSVLYNVKYNHVEELEKQLPTINLYDSYLPSKFEPYIKYNELLTGYAMYYGSKDVFKLLIKNKAPLPQGYANSEDYNLGIISGFVSPNLLLLDFQGIFREYGQDIMLILRTSLRFYRREYFLNSLMALAQELNPADFENIILEQGHSLSVFNLPLYFEALEMFNQSADIFHEVYSKYLCQSISVNQDGEEEFNQSILFQNILDWDSNMNSLIKAKYFMSQKMSPLCRTIQTNMNFFDFAYIQDKSDIVDLLKQKHILPSSYYEETNYERIGVSIKKSRNFNQQQLRSFAKIM